MTEIERALCALNYLDAGCSREEWVRIGMATKSAGLSFDDFNNWSASGSNYESEKSCLTVWKSFNNHGAVTPATLYGMAFARGWKDPSKSCTHKTNMNTNAIIKAKSRVNKTVSSSAITVWKRCIPAKSDEVYIHRKKGIPDGLRVYPSSVSQLIISGQNVAGYLVIPCWSDEQLQTLQFISPNDGRKLNLPGSTFNDGFFNVGDITDSRIYICEGIGQAWAVNKATGAATVVCFGSHRMMTIAKILRIKYPTANLVLIPDRGKEKQASEIAAAISGLWIDMPQDKPNNYDANDYAQEFGHKALASLIEFKELNAVSDISITNWFSVPTLSRSDARDGTYNTRPLTELGNSQRLFDINGDNLKYVYDTHSWIFWNNVSWQWDNGSIVRSLAAQLPAAIYAEGAGHANDVEYFAKWARKSQEQRIIIASVHMLSDFPRIRLPLKFIDANHFTVGFNQSRQIIDLQNGTTRDALQPDYITKSLGAETIGDAYEAKRWMQFLNQIFDGDEELIGWVQRFCGYCLTGSTQEQIFLFCFGHGSNGKSVFIELLKHVMGDYSRVIASETVSERKRQAGGATPDLAALIGARLVICSETEDNAVLAESLVKSLVAGDSMAVRPLYTAPVEFKPNCKLLMVGNHKPVVKSNNNGIWRRVRLLSFNRTFTPEERDPHLLAKLKEETPHILAWMVMGCINWQKEGLTNLPTVIRNATEAYQVDQDIIGRWLNECTSSSMNGEVLANDLYANYKAWCIDNGLRPASAIALGRRLSERGFNVRQSNGKRWWGVLTLIDSRRYSNNYRCETGDY